MVFVLCWLLGCLLLICFGYLFDMFSVCLVFDLICFGVLVMWLLFSCALRS